MPQARERVATVSAFLTVGFWRPSDASASQTLTSGKVIFDVGIGEVQCAGMLGANQRDRSLTNSHTLLNLKWDLEIPDGEEP
jgi:hypothetical protein